MTSRVEILTERFRLRELTDVDVSERYLGWLRDREAKRYIAAAQQTPALSTLVEYVRQRVNRPDVLFLGIFEKMSGLHVGNIKYEPVDSVQGYAIMGILIGDPTFRGKGVAAEVLQASANWLRQHRGIRQILLGVSRENVGAIRAYDKVGFVEVTSAHITKQNDETITMGWTL